MLFFFNPFFGNTSLLSLFSVSIGKPRANCFGWDIVVNQFFNIGVHEQTVDEIDHWSEGIKAVLFSAKKGFRIFSPFQSYLNGKENKGKKKKAEKWKENKKRKEKEEDKGGDTNTGTWSNTQDKSLWNYRAHRGRTGANVKQLSYCINCREFIAYTRMTIVRLT